MTGTCLLNNCLIIQERFIIMHYPLFIAVYYRCLLLFIGHSSASSWFIIEFLLPGHWMNRLLGRDRKKEFERQQLPSRHDTSSQRLALRKDTLRLKFQKSSRQTDRQTVKHSDADFITQVYFFTRC